MLRHRRRSLAGPIVLIILGVVFLLGNIGYVSWARLGYLFARYWPVLIIVWGLVKLLEHYQARREGYVYGGIGAGGVFWLIVLILFGLSASGAYRYRDAFKDIQIDDDTGLWGIFGTPYNYTDDLEQSFPAGATLRVVSDRGDVTVNAWDQDKIKVSIRKKVMADSQSKAESVNAATKPTITVANNVVTLSANTSSAGREYRVDTDLEIFLPRKAAVEVATANGTVNVRDRVGDLKLSTTRNDVEASGIQGNVDITMRGGSVRAEKVSGDVHVSGRVNDATVSAAGGTVTLNGDFFGSINLSKIAKTVRFQSSRTDMELAGLQGDLNMESGDLKASDLAGPIRISTKAKDIRLNDFSGDVRLEDSRADINLEPGKLPLGNITINNSKGRIQLVLPAKAAFQLDAQTSHGDISSDFSELKVENRANRSRATGSVGSGGPQVQLSTEHGDIEIRKAG